MKLSQWQTARATDPEVQARIVEEKRRKREFNLALKARRDAALAKYHVCADGARRECSERRPVLDMDGFPIPLSRKGAA